MGVDPKNKALNPRPITKIARIRGDVKLNESVTFRCFFNTQIKLNQTNPENSKKKTNTPTGCVSVVVPTRNSIDINRIIKRDIPIRNARINKDL